MAFGRSDGCAEAAPPLPLLVDAALGVGVRLVGAAAMAAAVGALARLMLRGGGRGAPPLSHRRLCRRIRGHRSGRRGRLSRGGGGSWGYSPAPLPETQPAVHVNGRSQPHPSCSGKPPVHPSQLLPAEALMRTAAQRWATTYDRPRPRLARRTLHKRRPAARARSGGRRRARGRPRPWRPWWRAK